MSQKIPVNSPNGTFFQQNFYNPQAAENAAVPLQNKPSSSFSPSASNVQAAASPLPFNPLTNSAQLGIQLGLNQALQSSQLKAINKWFSFEHLRYYFDVSHDYVFKKLLLILFPFNNKNWQRSSFGSEDYTSIAAHMGGTQQTFGRETENACSFLTNGYKSAREDVNAPDMYIPSMALVTYVILVGLIMGVQKHVYNPEQLWITGSTAIIFSGLEVFFIKLGCYLLNIGGSGPSMLDLIAFCGYKFVPVVGCQLVGLLFGRRLFLWLFFTYASLALSFFVLRSLRRLIMFDSDASLSIPEHRKKRVHFLFGVSMLQFLCSYFMVKWSF